MSPSIGVKRSVSNHGGAALAPPFPQGASSDRALAILPIFRPEDDRVSCFHILPEQGVWFPVEKRKPPLAGVRAMRARASAN